jgi:hypothetical protein
VAQGGVFRSFAPGGIVTTHAFIPHNDPFPTLEHLFSMFAGHGGFGSNSIGGDIVINHTTHIDGNGKVNEREFIERFRVEQGKALRKFR